MGPNCIFLRDCVKCWDRRVVVVVVRWYSVQRNARREVGRNKSD